MATPYPSYPSRLQINANDWEINLQTAGSSQLVGLCYKTLFGIFNEFNSQELDDLARNEDFVKGLRADVREITNLLYSVASSNREMRGVMDAIFYLEEAREQLAIAFIMFDETQVTNDVARIQARVPALNAFGQRLRKVIQSWPSKYKI